MNEGALKRRLAGIAMAATLSLVGGGVAAQEIPEGQSCGGLVCDLGLFGHKTAPKTAPAPAAAGIPVPAPQEATARPEPPQEPKRAALRKKNRVAKATVPRSVPRATASRAAPEPAPVAATLSPPPAAPVAAPPPAGSPIAAALSPPPSMMAPPALPPIPVTATPSPPVVLANPYVYSKPLPFMFQSVDPTQSVQ